MAATGPILNLDETADYLRVSRRTVGALIASGELPHRRIGPDGGRIVTTAEDREAYLDAHRSGQAA